MRQVLNDLLDYLKTLKLTPQKKINGEGRVGSLMDENYIVQHLTNHPIWKDFVYKSDKVRFSGDLIVRDYDSNHPPHLFNIKTTYLTTDNATSIVGFAYGLTDLTIDELPSKMNEKQLIELIKTRPNNLKSKDYYYLVFDKSNMKNVNIRALKDIEFWVSNPSNRLQIKWSEEFNNTNITKAENVSADRIIKKLKECWDKKCALMPSDWSINLIS